jgi:glycopeptide antibiotics resistance protein
MVPVAERPVGAGGRWRVAARVAYAGVIFLATLTRLHADPDPGEIVRRLGNALSPTVGPRDTVDGIRNILLFAGWGATWILTAGAGPLWRRVVSAMLVGGALSFLVEVVQLVSPVRTSSILDLTTNTGGALVGALVVALAVDLVRTGVGRRSFVGVPAFLFAGTYLGAVLLETLVPLFRHGPVPGSAGGPLTRFAASWAAFRADPNLNPPVIDLALFAPAGAFVVMALAEAGLGYRAAAWIAAVGGAVAVGAVEVARGLAGEPIEPGAFVVHAAAIGLGAALAARGLPGLTVRLRGRARPRALWAAYIVVLALWSLRPFLPELDGAAIREQFSSGHFIPLKALGGRVDLFSATDICIQFLLYVPLGGLLAVWPLRGAGALAGFAPAVIVALVLEAGQILVAGRFFDVTDLLVQGAGAACGWILVRRAGFRPYGEMQVGPVVGGGRVARARAPDGASW